VIQKYPSTTSKGIQNLKVGHFQKYLFIFKKQRSNLNKGAVLSNNCSKFGED